MNSGAGVTSSLALPLRIGANGQLERVDQERSIVALFAAMGVTVPGGWPHAPWFALEHLFSRANPHVQEHPVIVDALNLALTRLGVPAIRVGSVRTDNDASSPGSRAFEITLVHADGQIVHERLQV